MPMSKNKGFPLGGSSAEGGDEGKAANPLIRLLRSHLPPRGKADPLTGVRKKFSFSVQTKDIICVRV